MIKGFFHKLLVVDLSRKTFSEEAIEDELLHRTMGGKGLATHLLLERNPPGVDPLSPESNLILALGAASDSPVYGSCRHGIFAKSPQTGLFGESYSGGRLAIPMSRCGFDAMVIHGSSATPVWLEISDGGVVFNDATDLWGQDTFATEKAIKERVDAKRPGIMVIGPAGENRVRFAVVKNDGWRVAGRTGMGAVFGAKNLKGIAFYGSQKRPFADPEGLKAYARETLKTFKDHPATQNYRSKGTPSMVEVMNKAGAFPNRYWSRGVMPGWEKISAEAIKASCQPKPHACQTCFMACGKRVELQGGRHAGLVLEGPEYETIYAFGGLCLIDSIEEIIYLNDLCDRLGVDTISTGNLVALAIEAARRGRIDMAIDYGQPEQAAKLVRDIAARQGTGKLLAEGIKRASRHLDLDDIAVHVKGLEPAGYEPRKLKGMGLAYAVSDRGACHLRSTFYKAELSKMIEPDEMNGKAEMFIDFENRCTLFDSLILCRFYRDFYDWNVLARIYSLTTGLSFTKADLKELAESITADARRFNLREGLTPDDDRLSQRLMTEAIEDGNRLTDDDLQWMIRDYFQLKGWGPDGIPPASEQTA
ncbi:aldehyde ferredoxin oxidoreductase family protein [Desulfosarcina ovata]|uniref:Tungsten-containing oxidoreductase n=2 Tax=Desulfosarcina ovata TaxID=83564 RepID=A0A5K8AHI8_9BACT|nr:aldehyde ferredoxin oxidoreductase family protein [Desulfosarcina ovata]BBO85235.1 tungsten-containing oxidoreductase [Desulfosarcina ovata subsp. sediminis]BBO92127.1 tungsten-containing oxidoreductase [Desulfosarcina ovata subsp. ovata]